MKSVNDLSKFPCVNQSGNYTCIPTSAANVINYHYRNRHVTPRKIVRWYLNKYFPDGTQGLREEEIYKPISFEKIKEVLLEKYDKDFTYIIKKKNKDFADFNGYLSFVEKKIDKDLPLIVSMKLPYPPWVHAVTFLGIGKKEILIYDTDPTKADKPSPKSIKSISSNILPCIHPNFTTFLIIPKKID